MDRAHGYEPWSSGGSIPLRHIIHPLFDDSPKQRDRKGHANFFKTMPPLRAVYFLSSPPESHPFQTLYLPHTVRFSHQRIK